MKTGFPVWIPALLYLLCCFLFSEPLLSIAGLFFALVLFLSATTSGRWIAQIFQNQNRSLDFPLGLGSILLGVFAIGSWNASQAVIWTLWSLLGLLALPSIKELKTRCPWYSLWGIPFFLLSSWSTFTPTTFYDALAYNLGIPYQYLAYGKIVTFSTWTTSFFPPFDQIFKFLFLAVAPQNTIKIFSFLIFLHALRMLNSRKPDDLDSKYIIIPLLLLPVPWILLHIVNPDLLTSLFFVAAACAIVQTKDGYRNVVLSATFLAFTCWTKYTIYPYVIFFAVLLWHSGIPLRAFMKKLAVFGVAFLIILLPLYIRNFALKHDPLYPMLNRVFATEWKQEQTAAVQKEFPTPKSWGEFTKRLFVTPISITFQWRSYGSASEIGFLPLLGLALLPFSFRKIDLRLFLFVLLCYAMWIFQLYHFRYFLPVYLVSILLLGYSFQFIGKILRKGMLALWVVAAAWSFYISTPVYRLFPLIRPELTQQSYLSERISYFDAAEFLRGIAKEERTIMVGETRNAYFHARLVPFSYTDQDPLLKWSSAVRDSNELYQKLKTENVGYILYNPQELKRLTEQYGIWKAAPEDNRKVSELLNRHGKILFSKNGVVVIRIQ
jgi:hypothetical protein